MKTGRFFQLTLIASILRLSWLGMMIVHELGHVLAAWVSGTGFQGRSSPADNLPNRHLA